MSGDGEEMPQYRISFKLHDNGLTRDLTMDYGDFSMKGKLVNLMLLPPLRPASSNFRLAVYVDDAIWPHAGRRWCHLLADDVFELHRFAARWE